MNEENIRVLVVDDTVTYRKIVGDVLAEIPGVEVIGTAANGRIALDKIDRLRPDMITLDLEMPEVDGLEVLRHLKQSGCDIGTIVLSGSTGQGAKSTMTALSLGAFDFVAKPAGGSPQENIHVLRQDLQPRINAYLRKRQVRQITQGHNKAAPKRVHSSPISHDTDISQRMRNITGRTSSHADVVAIGISTGGPQALNSMLPELPASLSVPVLVVQHMPPVFTKSLADELNKRCALSVCEAEHGQDVLPGHVYIAPGGKQMKVVRKAGQTTIVINEDPPENSCRPSVDYLFRSVANVYGGNAVGVIMTGMGSDGTLGSQQMKQTGATIIAQDEDSCVVFGMPRAPIEDGTADIILPLSEIAKEITQLTVQGVVACK